MENLIYLLITTIIISGIIYLIQTNKNLKKQIRQIQQNNMITSNTVANANAQTENKEIYPYVSRNKLLTDNERKFYYCLKEICRNQDIVIFSKVRLADLVDVLPHSDRSYFWKIQSKHIDFVLCRGSDFRILLCIELNDISHMDNSRTERDVFISNLFNKVNIPIVFLPTKHYYSPQEVFEKISPYIPITPNFNVINGFKGKVSQN